MDCGRVRKATISSSFNISIPFCFFSGTPKTLCLLAKEDSDEAKEKLKSSMYHLVENLRKIAVLITPFMEETAGKIFMQLGLNEEKFKTWDSLKTLCEFETKVIEVGEPLFMRKDREEEIEYIKSLMK